MLVAADPSRPNTIPARPVAAELAMNWRREIRIMSVEQFLFAIAAKHSTIKTLAIPFLKRWLRW